MSCNIVAVAQVNPSGAFVNSMGFTGINKVDTGTYELTMDWAIGQSEGVIVTTPLVGASNPFTPNPSPACANHLNSSGNILTVYVYDSQNGNKLDYAFSTAVMRNI